MNSKNMMFKHLPMNTPFSPAIGEVGSTSVYMKRKNGVCPKIGTNEVGIFHPGDEVVKMFLPPAVLKMYP